MPGFPFKEIIQSQTPDRLRTNITFRMKVDAITHINYSYKSLAANIYSNPLLLKAQCKIYHKTFKLQTYKVIQITYLPSVSQVHFPEIL